MSVTKPQYAIDESCSALSVPVLSQCATFNTYFAIPDTGLTAYLGEYQANPGQKRTNPGRGLSVADKSDSLVVKLCALEAPILVSLGYSADETRCVDASKVRQA